MGDIKPKVSVMSEKQGWEKSALEAQEGLLLPNVTWEDSQTTLLLWLAFESLLLLYFISMIKEEINLAFLEISPIFLWPVSSWPLWSGKMAVGITYFVSWVYLAHRTSIQRFLYIIANLQIPTIWFFICPIYYLCNAQFVLGKVQDKQRMLSLLSRDWNYEWVTDIAVFNHQSVVWSRLPYR